MKITPMPSALNLSEHLYRLLLCLYPAKFRRVYSREMLLLFRDCYREASQRGNVREIIHFWSFILSELMISVCVEYYRTMLTQLRHLMGVEKEFLMTNGLLSLEVATLTDKGIKRPHNEDSMASIVPQDVQVMTQKGALLVVADGMSGHDKGEVASEMIVQKVSDYYYQDASTDIGASLVQAIRQANLALRQRIEAEEWQSDRSMGTTCIAAVLHGATAFIANVGDSRAYIVREGKARQISLDHSWVAEQVRLGALTEEEARTHEKRNIITRCIGTQADVEIDLFTEPVQDGDILVLCTDGLTSVVRDEEIAAIVTQYDSQESTARLIARANENGGTDNITAVVVHVSL